MIKQFAKKDSVGDYVLHADAEAELSRLREQLEAANRKIERLEAPVSDGEKTRIRLAVAHHSLDSANMIIIVGAIIAARTKETS